jgi:hypothetical protein
MTKALVKKLCLFLCSVILIHFLFVFAKSQPSDTLVKVTDSASIDEVKTDISDNTNPTNKNVLLFEKLGLGQLGLSRQAFDYALKGYTYLLLSNKLNNERILSIVDFSLPSSKKRLFVIDVKEGKLLYNTYVSHGRNSGREKATQFSNSPESFQSSLGFYVTKDTYVGKHGFSLRLQGEDKGFNDNAMSRAIVMHNASYVDESLIRSQGYIGRSLGCPAIPEKLHKPIIEKIKNGSCLFLYSPDKNYTSRSKILNSIA